MFLQKEKLENNRRSRRMKADYLVKYRPSADSNEEVLSNLRNLSSTGALFVSYEFLPEGAEVRLSICVPPLERTLDCFARVMRTRQVEDGFYLISTHFLNLHPINQKLLHEFIERL